jgi:hypothetical protein
VLCWILLHWLYSCGALKAYMATGYINGSIKLGIL